MSWKCVFWIRKYGRGLFSSNHEKYKKTTSLAIIFHYRTNAPQGTEVCVCAGVLQGDEPIRDALIREGLEALGISPRPDFALLKKDGMPYLKNGGVNVNLSISHSDGLIMVALSKTNAVGIDIENKNRKVSDKLIDRIVSCGEEKRINPLRLWTIKEAWLKMEGTGLRMAMKGIRVWPDGPNRYRAESTQTGRGGGAIGIVYRDFYVSLAIGETI